MPDGTCLLCTNTKDLVNSHFLPAASYKAQYAAGLNVNQPMVITAKRVFQSSRHITAHAFCGDCEDIFNKNGESWVVEKLATLTVFPLRDMILAAPPLIPPEPDFKIFSCDAIPGFEREKFVHFMMGIFWKSAARTWNMLDGPPEQIELGRYREPLRQFILGTAPFPRYMKLLTFIEAGTPLIATTPPQRFQQKGCHLFGFQMNGLVSWLAVGKGAGALFGDSCTATAPGHPIFVVPDAAKSMMDDLKKKLRNVRPSTGVMKTFEEVKLRRGKK